MRNWLTIAAVALVYVATAKLGLAFDAVSGFASLVWPRTGISLAALVLFGPRVWPGIAIGAFAVNLWVGAPPWVAGGIAIGNTLEAVVGAYALRLCGFDRSFGRLRDVISFVLTACLLSTLLSATIGVASLWAGGIVPTVTSFATWRAWWLGDVLGNLVVAPAVLIWARRPRRPIRARRLLDAAVLALFVILAGFVAFGGIGPQHDNPTLPYLVYPSLIWAALSFRQRGVTAAILVISIVAIGATSAGLAPFSRGSLNPSLFFLQVYLGVVAATMLVLAAALSERDRAAQSRDAVIGQLEKAEQRARFVAEASKVLSSALEYERTLENIARLVVPTLGDNCVVDMLEPDGTLRRIGAEQI